MEQCSGSADLPHICRATCLFGGTWCIGRTECRLASEEDVVMMVVMRVNVRDKAILASAVAPFTVASLLDRR